MSYDRRALTVTVDSLKPWKQDLRKMTQIYKSIASASEEKSVEIFEEAHKLFKTFRKSFETWVYKVVLPSTEKKQQSIMEQDVATKAWDAVINLGDGQMFPTTWDYQTDTYHSDPRKAISDMQRTVLRYQRKMNEALKSIEMYIEARGGTLDRHPEIEKLQIAGMNVVIHNSGRFSGGKENVEHREEHLKDELSTLGDAARKMTQAGFGGAVKGLTIHLKWDRSDLRAGQYDANADELTLFPLGIGREDNSTFIHECGHRYYYRAMPSQARAYWEEVIDARAVEITAVDVRSFIDDFIRPYYRSHGSLPFFSTTKSEARNVEDEVARAKAMFLADGLPAFTNTPEEVERFLLDNRVGNRVNLEHISDYGAENAKEAFAEAFMLWVTKGPRAVGPWTRDFFVRLTRAGAGGARYAYKR